MNELKTLQEEEMTVKILNILAWQQNITNQGFNYTGEKDWALNKIRGLLQESFTLGIMKGVEVVEGVVPEEKKGTGELLTDESVYTQGYNNYRYEFISNLNKLKQELK